MTTACSTGLIVALAGFAEWLVVGFAGRLVTGKFTTGLAGKFKADQPIVAKIFLFSRTCIYAFNTTRLIRIKFNTRMYGLEFLNGDVKT